MEQKTLLLDQSEYELLRWTLIEAHHNYYHRISEQESPKVKEAFIRIQDRLMALFDKVKLLEGEGNEDDSRRD
jgi:hypothetical protein